MLVRISLWSSLALLVAGQLLRSGPALAFSPYRSTDADTTDPYTMELQVGLIEVERKGRENKYVSPELRINFGLPNKVELISEFAYVPEEDEFGDGAVGIKWVPVFGILSIGIETLLLVPVRPGDDGAGIESQLLATWRNNNVRIHVNAGGFHDARTSPEEDGWRASILTEVPRDRVRPGVELFAIQESGKDVDLQLGMGIIIDVGRFDIRSGLHAGLTHEAPDFVFSFWITTRLPFR